MTEIAPFVASSIHCTIAFFGPDGAGKSTVIDAVSHRIKGCAETVEKRYLRPNFPGLRTESFSLGPGGDPHTRPAKSPVASTLQLTLWFCAYWLDRLSRRKRRSTLTIYDRYVHDVLVDRKRYRYGGPVWFARAVSRFVPQPDAVIKLDCPTEVLQACKQEVPASETERQRLGYLEIARSLRNTHIVDASQSLDAVVAQVEEIVLNHLSARGGKPLGARV